MLSNTFCISLHFIHSLIIDNAQEQEEKAEVSLEPEQDGLERPQVVQPVDGGVRSRGEAEREVRRPALGHRLLSEERRAAAEEEVEQVPARAVLLSAVRLSLRHADNLHQSHQG